MSHQGAAPGVEKQMNAFEKATLRWAKVAVLMSLLAAVFVCLQWVEMHTGATDTHTLAEAAKKQAEKMDTMSTAADKIRAASENMVTQEQRIADNAQKALDASNRQSKLSLDAAIRQFHQDQRAWVNVVRESMDEIKEEKPISFKVDITNSGRTPARKAIIESYVTVADHDIPSEDELMRGAQQETPNSVGVLAPGVSFSAPSEITTGAVLPVKAKLGSSGYIYIWGKITYQDVFTRKHETEYCGYRSIAWTTRPDYQQCKFHNEAN